MARQAETQMTAAGPGEKNNLLRQIGNVISKPGEKGEIRGAAPTQSVSEGGQHNTTGFTPMAKARLLDRWLDRVVAAAGSQSALAVIMSGLLTWALLGIHYGHDNLWQILISDIQAIVNYIYDSFLVRQQLNGYDDGMYATIQLQSRLLSHVRMLDRVRRGSGFDELVDLSNQQQLSDRDISDFADSLPPETRFGRFVTKTSEILGHLLTICAYWVAVFVWIGIGPLNGWSNDWQLYMNSASSATMVFSFAFIANVRERHSAYMERCLDLIFKVDSALEIKLRRLTGDSLDNPVVVAPPPKMSKIQRATFYYADFVGTLIGIAILVCVMVTWVAIGPVLDFNDNWWLIIGTYAGLVGMNDGFVLRNIQARLNSYVEREFDEIDVGDERLFGAIGLTPPPRETIHDPSLTYRLSEVMARVCAHEITVVLGVLTLVGLVAGSSAMRWSFTGQLLSNVPPSLIENFLMLVLITGHNAADKRSRVNLRNLYDRRLMLLSFVNRLENAARDRDVLSLGDGTKEPASVSCRPKHDA